MILKQLQLQNFRNYSKKEFDFSDKTTLVVGPNASGKTNLLEAIYLLATSKSFKADLEGEMISYEKELSRVKGTIEKNGQKENLEIVLTRGFVQNEKVAHKKCLVNGVAKRQTDFIGNLRAVYFGPEDLELVTDSPSTRRKYLDMVLTQVDREYTRALLSYEKGLRARNKVLEAIRETGAPRSQLFFWNQLLVRNGELITQKREEYVNSVNSYQSSVFSLQYKVEYDKSLISAARLEQYKEEEVAAGATLVGPHRDDWLIRINANGNNANQLSEYGGRDISAYGSRGEPRISRDLSVYGSRGEQRLAVLWLKLCERAFIEEKTQELPILLLDDIFSELDKEHRELVWQVVGKQQTIITTADIEQIGPEWSKKAEVIELE